jgi:hypothetical protein
VAVREVEQVWGRVPRLTVPIPGVRDHKLAALFDTLDVPVPSELRE